jgi:hypothetical protein
MKLWFVVSTFEKLPQFSQGNNELDTVASNIDGFSWRDTGVSSTHLNKPILSKHSVSPFWKLWFAGSIPFKH